MTDRRWSGRLLTLLTVLGLTGCSLFAPNSAQGEVTPIIDGLAGVHPRQICTNGDNGRGLDNDVPWFDDYLEVDLAPDPLPTIQSSAFGRGFQLGEDNRLINDLKGIPRPEGYVVVPYGNEHFNPTSSYLIATRNGATLQVTVTRSGTVSLYCSSDNNRRYGDQMSTRQGKAIVLLSMAMPRT